LLDADDHSRRQTNPTVANVETHTQGGKGADVLLSLSLQAKPLKDKIGVDKAQVAH
jgi:hypothetical protein